MFKHFLVLLILLDLVFYFIFENAELDFCLIGLTILAYLSIFCASLKVVKEAHSSTEYESLELFSDFSNLVIISC